MNDEESADVAATVTPSPDDAPSNGASALAETAHGVDVAQGVAPSYAGIAAMCGAKTRSGKPCRGPVMKGGTRCRLHGGSSPQARAKAVDRKAIMDSIDAAAPSAVMRLHREIVHGENAAASVRASVDVLDRGGYRKADSGNDDEYREILVRLRERRERGPAPDSHGHHPDAA